MMEYQLYLCDITGQHTFIERQKQQKLICHSGDDSDNLLLKSGVLKGVTFLSYTSYRDPSLMSTNVTKTT